MNEMMDRMAKFFLAEILIAAMVIIGGNALFFGMLHFLGGI